MSFKELKERKQRMPKAFIGGVGAGPVPARYPQALCPLKAALLLSENSMKALVVLKLTLQLCVSALKKIPTYF